MRLGTTERKNGIIASPVTSISTEVTMRRVSIKTVDGSRFEFVDDGKYSFTNVLALPDFLTIEIYGGRKLINMKNVISITETEVDG